MNKMTRVFAFVIFLSGFATMAPCMAQCDVKRFRELIKEGDRYGRMPDYLKAMNAYSAAMVACKDKIPEAQDRVWKLFNEISQLKNIADQERQKAIWERNNATMQKNRADSLYKVADSAWKVTSKILDKIYFYKDKYGLALKKDSLSNIKLYGFIDRNGNEIIGFEYLEANPFNELTGFAKVKRENFYYLRDTTGHEYQLCEDYKLLNDNYEAFEMHQIGTAQLPEVLNYKQLRILLISDNNLTKVPGPLSQLKSLFFLDLSRGGIDSITPEIGKLQNLKWLNLSSNKLAALPPGMGNLSNLSYLNLTSNYLTSLPDTFSELKNLKELYLRGNRFPDPEKRRITELIPKGCNIIW